MYFGIVHVPVLSVGVSLYLFYTFIHIYYCIYSDYSMTIGLADPKSGISRQINYPVMLARTGNEKDLETKRLAYLHFFSALSHTDMKE